MLAKKTSKNQLTLPKEIVKEFPDIDYFDAQVKGHAIVLTPVKIAGGHEHRNSGEDGEPWHSRDRRA
jgi:hypothetical protein